MNEVNKTAQIPTNAFAEETLLLSFGAEFVHPLYVGLNKFILGRRLTDDYDWPTFKASRKPAITLSRL